MTYSQRIDRLTQTLALIPQLNEEIADGSRAAYPDLRGALPPADFARWALTPEVLDEISLQLEKARAAPEPDFAALDRADDLMYGVVQHMNDVREYWRVVPQISWRSRWDSFAAANSLKPAAAPPDLDFEETQLLEALNAGRFAAAARRTQAIEELVDAAMRKAIPGIIKGRKPRDIVYVNRTTPCPTDDGSPGAATSRLTRPGDPDAWFPPGAKRRGEHGSIVIRARIAATSCATAFAVMVSSGYPDLDAAGLQVAEASRYKAAEEAGKPRASELDFKVRFEIEYDEEPPENAPPK